MFANVEKTLKTVALINLVCGIIVAVVALLGSAIVADGKLFMVGLTVGAVQFINSLVASLILYAFAELLENTKEMNRTLKVGYAGDLEQEKEKEAEAERVLAAQAEWERQQREEAEEKARQEREAAEAAKQARIAAYWNKHQKEKKALEEKYTAAVQKLREGGLAKGQREVLEKLARDIEAELGKDREEE